jgi:hypothetical protein
MGMGHEELDAATHWRGRQPTRDETLVDSGLQYRPGDPVLVRVVRREQRTSVSDDGTAIAKAGRPPRWREIADRVEHASVVNVSPHGVVSLPVVAVGPGFEAVVRRIAEASLDLYQGLLELEE